MGKTFALCIYFEPEAPHRIRKKKPGNSRYLLANFQWMVVEGIEGHRESEWLFAGDDPEMTSDDVLAFYIADITGEQPANTQFEFFWKSRTSAGTWDDDKPPYIPDTSEPLPLYTKEDPGVPGLRKGQTVPSWFMRPRPLRDMRETTFSCTMRTSHEGVVRRYWMDPEMELGPPS